jgi:large subunit ribosomal protein L25
MQRHPYKQRIMHLDFQRVDANQALRASVPLHFVNEEKSPAGKSAGVVITHELTQVEVSCLPKDLPGNIEVDLSELKAGDTIHLSQVKLPAGVELPHKPDAEHDVAVAVARMARTETEETAEGAAETPAAAPAAEAGEAGDDKGE